MKTYCKQYQFCGVQYAQTVSDAQSIYEHSMGLFNDITGAEFGVSVTGGYWISINNTYPGRYVLEIVELS